ncbi:MAG: class I SAM-dependent methyltransferase [Candidatus Aminicenantaceae bacterium]
MRRTIENLTYERKKIEEEFKNKINELKEQSKKDLTHLNDYLFSILELIELNASLTDSKDKEWDVLGSNHVRNIFKSMEWRIDKLSNEYEDVKILMKKFFLLKEKLNNLLNILEDKKIPSAKQIQEISSPIEESQYTGFENRFRGPEEKVKQQQKEFLPYFEKGTILDLGCGRGEFLELLEEKGIKGLGIDNNSQMIDICLDKGLNCQKGDILEKLSEFKDKSLSGIFSSQVIEHLTPEYLKKLIELASVKLMPSSYLILETINPASVFTLVQTYFLDLSHQKPVHPQTLKFLMESSRFEEVEIKYFSSLVEEKLQNLPGADETTSIINKNIDNLNNLLYAPANYAAIGQKK